MKTNPSKILTALALATLLTSGTGAWAQGGPSPSMTPSATPATMEKTEKHGGAARGPREGNMLEKWTKDLSLTPEQVEKIKPILEAQRDKVRALHDDKSGTPETKREKAMEIRTASRKEIADILTPEQKAKFESMRPGAGKEKRTKAHDEVTAPASTEGAPAASATP